MFNIKEIILNLIVVLFPIIIYFIFECYYALVNKNNNKDLVLSICLISSEYLLYKYGKGISISIIIYYPILVSMLKRKIKISILLSIISIIVISLLGLTNIVVTTITIIILTISNTIIKNKNKFIEVSSIIISFFSSFSYMIFIEEKSFQNIYELIIIIIIFYFMSYTILFLLDMIDKITKLYKSSVELEQDKQLKNSLFKIVHEVKNPIAVCKGYLDMMDYNDINKTKKYIKTIKEEIDRSLNIMTDFMEFSKIKLNKDILDINMLVEEVSEEMLSICQNKITIEYENNDDEIYINGDYQRLKQVLINLIKNSIESIEDKGKIEINNYVKDTNYYIVIKDNGIGMDKETLNKISELFFTTKVRGSGLGVSLSREIIKLHDGTITYDSKKNIGTKVTIKLPIYSC